MRYPSEEEVTARLAAARRNVLSQIPTAPRRRRRLRRLGIGVAVLVGAATLTATAVAIHQATTEQITYSVDCFEKADMTSRSASVESSEATNNLTGATSREPTDPVTSCQDMWRMGLLGQMTPPADPDTADFPVPDIVACKEANGVGAGFPRGDSTLSNAEFCQDLGLAAWRS